MRMHVAQLALGRAPAFMEHAPPELGGIMYGCFRCAGIYFHSWGASRTALPTLIVENETHYSARSTHDC
eukprot:1161703-Pelagomonas_calceolata.AAC.5